MDKLSVHRWQYDEIEHILAAGVNFDWEEGERLTAERFEVKKVYPWTDDLPIIYVIFGYEHNAMHWRLEHGISPKDTVLARDWMKLQGRRGRVLPIYANREWYRLNRNHEIVKNCQREIYELERRYGTVSMDEIPVKSAGH